MRNLAIGTSERENERTILGASYDLCAEALKVGHHGSDTSSRAPFLDAIGPEVAIISVGDGNQYGLPDDEVLGRLAGSGVTVERTDRNGTVTVRIDEFGYEADVEFGPEKGCCVYLPLIAGAEGTTHS